MSKTTTRHKPPTTGKFPRQLLCSLLFASLLAAGCSDSTVNPANHKKNHPKPETFGLMEVTISGIGSSNMKATATPAGGGKSGPVTSSIARVSSSGSFIQMEPVSNGSFTYGTRGSGGQRYIYATFKVRNAQADGTPYGDARQNLTFLAADTDPSATATETIGQTAIATLRLFDGTELSGSKTAPTIAENTIPTGQVAQNGSSEVIPTSADVLQVYTENDLNDITPPSGVSLFPYGFVTRNATTSSSRTLPANPAPGQFDGEVTFAFKLPLQASANKDPFKISALFLPVDDSETRITQSLEEQTAGGRTALAARISDLNPGAVTLLPGSSYRGRGSLQCNAVRVAGPAGSPAATLFPQPPTFRSLAPDPYASNGSAARIAANTAFTATFSAPIANPNARNFVVQGLQSGQQFTGQAYSGGGTATVSSPAGSFFPGEPVEVSLTPGLGLCPGGRIARYRIAPTGGSGGFGAQAIFPAGNSSRSVALGDLNGDGALDMATANLIDSNVSVRLGDGAGGFGAQATFPVGNGPQSVALGDLDGDGALDMVTANGGSNNVSGRLGDGAGGFGAQATFPVGNSPTSVALGDLDGDGALDVVTANDNDNNVSVRLGNGAGGFGAQAIFPVGGGPRSVALGDLDGDGALDMVTANGGSNNVSVRLGDGAGGFGAQATFPVGRGPSSVALGDLDGDGALDMVTANDNDNNVSVRLGNGAGGFGAQATFPVGGGPSSVALGDLDGDGALDVATANDNDNNVSVRLGGGSGGFGAQATFSVGGFPTSMALGDVNGDGALDVATANFFGNNVSVLLNQ